MKKIYILLISLSACSAAFAQSFIRRSPATPEVFPLSAGSAESKMINPQVLPDPASVTDTLRSHFTGTPVIYTADLDGNGQNESFLAGHNIYKDAAFMQKFDTAYGVSSTGTISELLLYCIAIPGVNPNDAITATIWDDNNGVPGNELATQDVLITDIVNAMDSAGTFTGVYTKAVFSSPVAIPSSRVFWAGIKIYYGATSITHYAALLTTTDPTQADGPGTSGDFPYAINYCFSQWSDNSFHSFGDTVGGGWGMDVALGVFPVVQLDAGGNAGTGKQSASEGSLLLQAFPNPCGSNVSFDYQLDRASAVSVTLRDVTGKTVQEIKGGVLPAGKHRLGLDVASLHRGFYYYTLTTATGICTGKLTVVH